MVRRHSRRVRDTKKNPYFEPRILVSVISCNTLPTNHPLGYLLTVPGLQVGSIILTSNNRRTSGYEHSTRVVGTNTSIPRLARFSWMTHAK